MKMANEEEPVLHVVVVGFHHKRGCQVEYSYPPLIEGNPVDSNQLPVEWKHLPSLALPDGAHNYDADNIYFHLPSRNDVRTTIYGISCYKQIESSKLVNRTTDVTRNTVQKSVCVLSKLPLYGLIQAKLELITHAYFGELDFSQVSLLEDTYQRLNSSLKSELLKGPQVFLGLSARSLMQQFRHKVLVLFKLMMLERRVLFYSSPASPTCSTLLSVLALFPGMIESGLSESACYHSNKQLSQTLKVTSVDSDLSEDYLEVHYKDSSPGGSDQGSPPKTSNDVAMEVDPNLPTPAQCDASQSAQSSTGKTPSSSELVAQACDIPVSIDSITQIQRVQSKDGLQNDEVILEDIKRNVDKTDPLQFLEDITHVQGVQKPRSGVSLGDAVSPELPSEGNMEDLLDTDECFSWDDNTGKLQIETVQEESSDSNVAEISSGKLDDFVQIPKLHNIEGFHDVNLEESEKAEKSSAGSDRVLRTDSVDSQSSVKSSASTVSNLSAAAYMLKSRLSSVLWPDEEEGRDEKEVEEGDVDNQAAEATPRSISPSSLPVNNLGMPLAVFSKGILCHPYLSLQYFDLLQDINIRGFVVGATNVLFRQKHNLLDVIVDISESKIHVFDSELRKQLNLSTADLRFAEYLVSTSTDDKGDHFLDDTEWEGGEEWLREQFRAYLIHLLSTTKFGDKTASFLGDKKHHSVDDKLLDDFGREFVSAWKTTNNYKLWHVGSHSGVSDSYVGHPFHGQLSVSDMKLKLSHTLSNSEKGKKVNAAMNTAGRAVAQTGKAVGGAFTSAKSAMTSWLTGFGRNNNQQQDETESALSD